MSDWKVIGLWIFAVVIIAICIALKRKFDPRNDAFRTVEREGWRFKKGNVISLNEYRKKRKQNG